MKRFYVYRVDPSNKYEFVENVEVYARTLYSPKTTIYTGVAIDTDNIENAEVVFSNPTSTFGEYLLADEPSATIYIRTLINLCLAIQEPDKESLIVKTKGIILQLAPINIALSQLARETFKVYGKPQGMTEEQIFEILRKNICEVWVRQFHYVKDGDDEMV